MHIKDNKRYYSKGRLTFKTFSNDKYIAMATARDFVGRAEKQGWCKGKEDSIIVAEYGVGYGYFALNFLKCVRSLDPLLYSKIEYHLYDYSEKMLKKAAACLKAGGEKNIAAEKCDAARAYPKIKPHYIRLNELWCDLPAKIFTLKKGQVYEVQARRYAKPGDQFTQAALEFLSSLPLGYYIVINDRAAEHLGSISKSLRPGGYADIFDYGFTEVDLPMEIWNESLKRAKDHVTYDVNFTFMQAYARGCLNMKAYVEKQDDYVSDTLKMRLYPVELKDGLYYMTKDEMNRPITKKYLLPHGYDEEYLSGKFSEPNDYYHFRVWKE